jgi:hypothetical protein
MNRLALEWVDTALALEEENREFRRLNLALLLWLVRNRDLVDVAYARIDERFPERRTA